MTLNRWLAIGGMAASILFLPVIFVIGETRSGYSHVADHISQLSAAGVSDAWAQSTNFVVFGVLIAGLALGLHRGIDRDRPVLGPVLVAIVGMSVGLGSAIFPEAQAGTPEGVVALLHDIAAVIGFAALAAAMLIALPRHFAHNPQWAGLIVPSRWMGSIATVLFIVFPLGVWGIVPAVEPLEGLIQRLFAVNALVWFFLVSLRLFQTSRAPAPSRDYA